jgi:RNA polymerase sigma factor (sigma-70 family)
MDKPFVEICYCPTIGKQICLEVSVEVKDLLEHTDRRFRSQRRQERRYLHGLGFIDGLTDAAIRYPDHTDPADLVMKKDLSNQLCLAISVLSVVQKRRLLLHFAGNLTYRDIAELEGVNYRTVGHSMQRAIKQLQKHLTK